MKRAGFRLALGVAAMTAALSLVGGAAAATAVQPDAVRLIEARLTEPDGSAAAGARVVVYAYPASLPHGKIATTWLGETTTDASGYAVVATTRSAELSRAKSSRGSVHLLIEVTSKTSTLTFDHYVAVKPAASSLERSTKMSGSPLSLSMTAAHDVKTTPAKSAGDVVAAASTGVTNHNCNAGWLTVWVPTSEKLTTNTRLQHLQTGAKSKVTYAWTNSSNTKMGVSYEYPGTKAPAGLSSSVQTSSGATFSRGNNQNVWARVGWEYRKYKKYCARSNGSWDHQEVYAGSWQWRPYRWTTATSYQATTSTFACASGRRSTISTPVWVSREESITFSGGVTVNGLSLSTNQTNSSGHKLTYTPTASKATLCGSDDYPLYAKNVKEVP